jgi:tetratricopeptide (TPR) repeat protein
MRLERRRWSITLGGSLILLAIAAFGLMGYRGWRDRLDRIELGEARRDMGEGRFRAARVRLTALASRRPDDGEVHYVLGLSEEFGGRRSAALAAWNRVSPESLFYPKAAAHRARVLIGEGKFSEAERLLVPLRERPGPLDPEVRQSLELLFRLEGRKSDVKGVIAQSWNGAVEPSIVLRRLQRFDRGAFPVGAVRLAVEHGDPDDDRVWLARANLAQNSGRLDEARKLLSDCEQRRPDDPVITRSLLDLEVVANDPVAAWHAAEKLPLHMLTNAERHRVQAWFAGFATDRETERKALEALVKVNPGETAAWDRLAELAFARGDRAEAEAFRQRKREINLIDARYEALLGREIQDASPSELAELAAQLGRDVEARGWLLIAKHTVTEPLITQVDSSSAPLTTFLEDVRPRNGFGPSGTPETSTVAMAFSDNAEAAGFRFVYDNGHADGRHRPPPEAMGGGVGLFDYDLDGFLDVYLVQAGPFPPGHGRQFDGDRLYRNKGDGTFEDVTERAGLSAFRRGYGHGVAVGDFDNDGKPDLFVTRWRSYALYHNKGDGTFEDVTDKMGLGGDRDWPTSAAFADLDNDGDLDLYVCHYLAYDEANPRRCHHPDAPTIDDCNPLDFDPLPDHAFRNDGGTFVEVTEAAGLSEKAGRGLGVVAADLDGDGLVDLYVANDMSANYLYKNLGGFRFQEIGLAAGAAASAEGGYKAGMGIACGDLNGDGLIDIAVTNYYGESTTFYQGLGRGVFADHSSAVGFSSATRVLLGFGITFADLDNDGRLDVLSANGHVADARPQVPWKMPIQLLRQGPSGRLADVSSHAGAPFSLNHLGRGLAVGDLDNDGRLDALVVCQNESTVYLHNATQGAGHAITIQLEGTRSNRDGIGAMVSVVAGKTTRTAPRFGGGSYQSADDPRLHFGLGSEDKVDRIEVRWPSGKVDAFEFERLPVDTRYLLREGETRPRSLGR